MANSAMIPFAGSQVPARQFLAWPSERELRGEERQLKQRLREIAARASEGMKSPDAARRHWSTALLRLLSWGARASMEDLDNALRALPGRERYTLKNLSDWLRYAELCSIPTVPFEHGPAMTQADIESSYEALQAGSYDALPESVRTEVIPWIARQQERGWMWRYEFCAPETIKEVLGCIRPQGYLHATRITVPFSVDQRVLHCLWETQLPAGGQTRLLSRPWVPGRFCDGFPVEFRVYRTPDGFAACNYYIQRPLPAEYASTMEQAVDLTRDLETRARALAAPGLPAFPSAYTVDWLLSAEGQLLMLEAGPPFTPTGGAHPCCFAFNKLVAGRRLLALEPGALGYCPPALQAHVDRVKRGENPIDVARQSGYPALTLLAFAALQGDRRAQLVAQKMADEHGS